MSGEYNARWPRAVFFDLDNTLVHRQRSIARYAERLLADFGHMAEAPDLQALTACIVQADNGGYLPAGSAHKTIKETVAHVVAAMPAWRRVPAASILDHWVTHLPSSTVAMPGAEKLVTALVKNGTHVGIISNGNEKSRRLTVQSMPFASKISQLLSSDALGMRKPDAQIFHLAATAASCAVEDCWYIGDHPINDVQGASAAGMRAIWLRGFHEWPAARTPHEYVIDELAEAQKILLS